MVSLVDYAPFMVYLAFSNLPSLRSVSISPLTCMKLPPCRSNGNPKRVKWDDCSVLLTCSDAKPPAVMNALARHAVCLKRYCPSSELPPSLRIAGTVSIEKELRTRIVWHIATRARWNEPAARYL